MNIYRKFSGFLGLFCPGMGQFLTGQFTQAIFAFGSVSIPLIWLAFLLNQMVIRQGLWTATNSSPTILDFAFITSFSQINNVPPPYYVLFALALIIHFWTASCAWRGDAQNNSDLESTESLPVPEKADTDVSELSNIPSLNNPSAKPEQAQLTTPEHVAVAQTNSLCERNE